MSRLQPHLSFLGFANDIMVHDWSFKYFLVQMQFLSLCFSKVDMLFGEALYLLKCGVRRYELNLFCHTGVTSNKAGVLVESRFLVSLLESAGTHSEVYSVNFCCPVESVLQQL